MANSKITILKKALLKVSLEELNKYKAMPDEDIQYSRDFEKNIKRLARKSRSFIWSITKTTPRKIAAILVAAILMFTMMLGISGIIKKDTTPFTVVSNDREIIINGNMGPNVKALVKDAYLPSYIPERFECTKSEADNLSVIYKWECGDEFLLYNQCSNKSTIYLNNENVTYVSEVIGKWTVYHCYEYAYRAFIWGDDEYIYSLMASITTDFEELKKIVASVEMAFPIQEDSDENDKKIEDVYIPTYTPSGFDCTNYSVKDNRVEYFLTNNKKYIYFFQDTVYRQLDLEDRLDVYSKKIINSYNVYYYTSFSEREFIWTDGNYEYHIFAPTSVDLDEIWAVIESVALAPDEIQD
ncbi:MAG: hypothetical protein J6B60_00980 [Clostridia bacterium]|nr:hypothetical protein [Clostridia bacterium]